MTQLTNYLALILVYFLIVYLTAIRRGGQKVLPWILLILAQAASLYYFRILCVYVAGIPFFAQYSERVCMYVTAGSLALVNILLIFLLSAIFIPKQRINSEEINIAVNVDEIPIIREDLEEPPKVEVQEQSDVLPDSPPITSDCDKKACAIDMDEEALFLTIQKLIDDGKTGEASKYLRMVAFFGTNPITMQKAKQILAGLQPQEKKV